jgi:predicted GNAT family acetyltransferase
MAIEHLTAHHRFVARLPEGDAVLTYRLKEDRLDIRTTYVPPAARGRGTGGALVEAALLHARAAGLKVIPTCSYVGPWVAAHPEYRELLVLSDGMPSPA